MPSGSPPERAGTPVRPAVDPRPDAPRVSCLMGTYGHERYIARALDSLLAQDYPADALEIVVVDDGSPDRTPEVVEPYLDRIRYIRKENAGLLDTVNVGLSACSGEYVAFFSGDDESPPSKISHQVALLERRPDVGLCYGDMEVIDADGRTVAPSFFAAHGLRPQRGQVLGALLQRNFVSGGSMMVRADLVHRFHPLPDDVAWEDWFIALRVAEVAELDYLDEPLSRYRLHGANLAGAARGDKLAALQRQEIAFRRWLLRTVESPLVPVEQLAAAAGMLEGVARQVSAHTGEPLEEVYAVTDGQRAAAAELAEAAVRMTPELGMRTAVAALGHDPLCRPAVAAIHTLDAARAAHARLSTEVDELLAGIRDHATIAFADELADNPRLLAAYAATVRPDDAATLVIYAPDADPVELEPRLLGALAAAGVAEEDCPDLLAAVVRSDAALERELARRAHAVLSDRELPAAFAALPPADVEVAAR